MSKSECESRTKSARARQKRAATRRRRPTDLPAAALSTSASTACGTRSNCSPHVGGNAHLHDLNWDFRTLRAALKQGAQFLQDSGYRSAFTTSTISTNEGEERRNPDAEAKANPIGFKTPSLGSNPSVPSDVGGELPLYGTGWMIAGALSDDSADEEDETPKSAKQREHDQQWDGWMRVAGEKVKIARMAAILGSEFAFFSGLRTRDGFPILTFPDSHAQLSFDDYQLLVSYLLVDLHPQESQAGEGNMSAQKRADNCRASVAGEYVLVIDRRHDKWSAVRMLFSYITAFLPVRVRVAFVLKPEGVLQRALEVGYRNVAAAAAAASGAVNNDLLDVDFRVVFCQSIVELHQNVGAEALTMDFGGSTPYHHIEWVQHRMDIERMKSSAATIAESLSEFGKCLRDTELPNDVDTTARILELQTAERDAIKEDFRISIRKGVALLRQIRQFEQKPNATEQLSPSRLHNVEAIERMLLQLEDTERSFDAFWARHRRRLSACLSIRRFEDAFRKLQSSFAKHMLYLEEHREIGHSIESAQRLIGEQEEYAQNAMADVKAARTLRADGDALLVEAEASIGEAINGANAAQFAASCDSLTAKRGELARMADALESSLGRRARILTLSQQMHARISEANNWCRRGVDLLTCSLNARSKAESSEAVNAMLEQLDELLHSGETLQLSALKRQTSSTEDDLMSLTNAETFSLLSQVAERIDDIRRLTITQRDAIRLKQQEREQDQAQTRVQARVRAQVQAQNQHQDQLAQESNAHKENASGEPTRHWRDSRDLGEPRSSPQHLAASDFRAANRRNSDTMALRSAGFAAGGFALLASASVAAPRAAFRARATKKPVQVVSPEKKMKAEEEEKVTEEECQKAENDKKENRRLNATETTLNGEPTVIVTGFHSQHPQQHVSRASSYSFASSSFESAERVDDAEITTLADDAEMSTSVAGSGAKTPIHTIPSTSLEEANGCGANSKLNYILEELLNTEESYVNELESLVEYYVKPFEAIENSTLIPAALRGRSDVIFGNLKDLAEFHRRFLLADLRHCEGSVSEICRVLVSHRKNFLALYRPYCQNKPQSETLRDFVEQNAAGSTGFAAAESCKFFTECQRRAGHALPLSAYLLKPIQRITKYQLLLKELARCAGGGDDAPNGVVDDALTAMLDVLGQLNADMQQLHIIGFAGDLRVFGALRLQTECEVHAFKRKSRRIANKPQRRHIFLFDGGVLFCKRRAPNVHYAAEYYEHKLCIPIHNLGFAECSKWSANRFELWDETRQDGYTVRIMDDDEKVRAKWIARLAKLTTRRQEKYEMEEEQKGRVEKRETDELCQQLVQQHQRRHSSYLGGGGDAATNTAQQQWQYQQQMLWEQRQHQQIGAQSTQLQTGQLIRPQAQQQMTQSAHLQLGQPQKNGRLSHHQQQQAQHCPRPQSWTSDGSCSAASSRSSFSTFDEVATIPESYMSPSEFNGLSNSSPIAVQPTFSNSLFGRRRLSALLGGAMGTHATEARPENNAMRAGASGAHITSIHIPASKSVQNYCDINMNDLTGNDTFNKHSFTGTMGTDQRGTTTYADTAAAESACRRHSRASNSALANASPTTSRPLLPFSSHLIGNGVNTVTTNQEELTAK